MKFDLEKRARDLFSYARNVFGHSSVVETLAIQLAREALAAQAEEIAQWCEKACDESMSDSRDWWIGHRFGLRDAAAYSRSLISKPEPEKTREKELEDALRDLVFRDPVCFCGDGIKICRHCRARRLLEKKP